VTLIIIFKATLALVGIPLAIGAYVSKAGDTEGTWIQKWATQNRYAVLLAILLVGGALTEIFSYKGATARKRNSLIFLEADHYQRELDNEPNRINSVAWVTQKMSLCRKFDHAHYTWRKKDYAETINTLLQLHNATDPYGELPRIESYVILNNLGVAYYQHQRNKEFKASMYLYQALGKVASGDPDYEVVDQNLRMLDEAVNSLD